MPGSTPLLLNFIARLWNLLCPPLRRNLIWLLHAKFIHGVSGIILDGQGRVLLLQHRFWKGQRWGLPGGLASHGESLGETLRRELLEEAGIAVRPTKLLRVSIARGVLTQFILFAESTGTPEAKPPEILDARFWDLTDLPENLQPDHRDLLRELPGLLDHPGLPVDP
jgi:ADP-ribose pyrophosphatase YjhB (NUDIX family)